ncbi:hypothetical protein V492_05275 [Pseudogymnoascus sp. VKM F-4246]|nr:hypothetical protein V492_05275 [Pseudogymnoascus sp. VKM F-4246]
MRRGDCASITVYRLRNESEKKSEREADVSVSWMLAACQRESWHVRCGLAGQAAAGVNQHPTTGSQPGRRAE